MIPPVSRPSASIAGRSWLMARLWSNRTPALIVNRSPIVMASLANAAAVMNWPPLMEGEAEIA
jgi:hypothetical protein